MSFCLFSQFAVQAQVSSEFQLAERLIRQQRFAPAADILSDLVAKHPEEYVFFERLIEARVQLKQYDEALQLVQDKIKTTSNPAPQRVLEGRLYYTMGDSTKAYSIWDSNLTDNPGEFQLYTATGHAMQNVRAYNKALEVYFKAREVFKNEQLFLNEIADIQMQTGNYEGAIKEWVNLIKVRPEQRAGLQRVLMRYNDPLIYDITIMELEDEMAQMNVADELYEHFYYLQSWLLLETKLYKRALNNAITFENAVPGTNYIIVFNLGKRLLDAEEFELAAEAYTYYTGSEDLEARWRSTEELAEVYSRQAKHKHDKNLSGSPSPDSLYKAAAGLLSDIENNAPAYRRLGNVILKQAEIALDHTHDLEAAKRAKEALATLDNFKNSAEYHYLDGRIELTEHDFIRARIAFTKSNKIADIGALAEKTRYFLALTDFFSGDFEYANIQLKSLGRQNTSYYANDALELRLWIQKNKNADSTHTYASDFAAAVFQNITGRRNSASEAFINIAESGASPYKEDALIALAQNRLTGGGTLLALLNKTLEQSSYLSQHERLLWERAFAADRLLNPEQTEDNTQKTLPVDPETVTGYYEELLVQYPQSFYAPFARSRLPQIMNLNS